ncbi:phage tail tube protein [Enterococcus cecorum]|uniref:phage tail tube protein n=1 Tax=Enterococcus cecorum TaxID=44008 RepID=UPI0032C42B36
MVYLDKHNIISGKEGSIFMTVDGRNINLIQTRQVEASLKLTKKEFAVLNKRIDQNKITGSKGEGKMNLYRMSSDFMKIAKQYLDSGQFPDVTLKVTNDDPQSFVGRNTVLLKGVVFDTIPLTSLDVDKEGLDEDVDFTFDDFDILDEFKAV